MEFSGTCPNCKGFRNCTVTSSDEKCPHCKEKLFIHPTDEFSLDFTLNQCPICGAGHLYKQKDFNRKIGVGILVIGILFAYFTYGISLLVVTVIDFCLYRYVGEVGCCYQCQAQYRGTESVKKLEGFDLEMHDYYRNLKN